MGTGSVDFLMNAVYTLTYKKFGFNVVSAYKKDLVNGQQLRYGDKLKEGLNVFYTLGAFKGIYLTPTAGINYDHVFYNVYQKQALTYTGGDYLNASAGIDVYYKHFAFSTSISPMLVSALNWSAEPTQRFSFETGVYYKF